MNTFQLECFLTVANTLSFARAAEQLNVSQPTITNQIKSLENELNTKLFHRSTRSVEITPEGNLFLSDAKSMVAISEQAKLRLRSSSEKAVQFFSLGCSNYVQLAILSEVLRQIKDEIPSLHPRLFVAPYEQLLQKLETDQLDLVFGIYDQTTTKTDIKYKELLQSNIVCICHKDHASVQKDSLMLSDLANEILIFCDPISLTPEMAKLQYHLSEGRKLSDMYFCSSSAASYVLAHSGFGIALLPDLLIPNDPEIVKMRLDDAPKLSFGLLYKPNADNSLSKRFIQLAKAHFEKIRTPEQTIPTDQTEYAET